jgi:hypothetical protein
MHTCSWNTTAPKLLYELSENEKTMFIQLGWEHMFVCRIHVMGLYNMAVEKAFITKAEGQHVDALRRAMISISNGHPRRHSREFEELIKI